MRQNKKLIMGLLALLMALPLTNYAAQEKTPAFPGAEGFGKYTTGGRGGKVYHVTNLNDSGTGSLRWANSQPGPRTIVFDVSGTIFLKSALKIANNTTVAGQTAPGDGICLADYPVTLGSNVICRYMRFRLGNRQVAYHEGDGLGSMDDNNIIVDHCSVSWSIDECLSVYGGKNLTVQWSITSQSLVNAGHAKGAHGYGGNWGGAGASFHHNLIAHHTSRTPRLGPRPGTQTDERMDMRNNVIYNWGGNGCYGGEGMKVNIVNNYYKPGPATAQRSTSIQQRIAGIGIRTSEYTNHNGTPNGWDVMWHVWGKYYVTGNVNTKYSNVTNDNWTYGMYNQIDNSKCDGTYTQKTKDTIRINEPIPFVAVTTHTAEKAYEQVMNCVGASLHRDALDDIIISDTRNGKATFTGSGNASGFINSQNDVAKSIPTLWPELVSETAPKDTDGDGMPDEWETQNGLNPSDATDGNDTNDEGYTNLELYMNSLVAHITEQQNAGGEQQGYIETLSVNPNGEEEGKETLSSGTVTWPFSTGKAGQTADYAADITEYLGTNSISLGSGLKFSGTQNISSMAFSKLQPATESSSANDNNAVSFAFDVKDGLFFRPTNIAMKIARIGTDGGRVDMKWQNAEGTYTFEEGLNPDRNNSTPGYTNYSKKTDNIPSATGTNTLKLHIYSLGTSKGMAIRDVVVTGEIKTETNGIGEVRTAIMGNGLIYNLKGEVVTKPRKGIYIQHGKKYVVK